MIWHEFQRPAQVEPEQEEHSETFARFLAQPFERGWGTTVGNALRRALLSSIPSAAITAVKIEGADHEFSAVPGVVEEHRNAVNMRRMSVRLLDHRPEAVEETVVRVAFNGRPISLHLKRIPVPKRLEESGIAERLGEIDGQKA